MLVFAVQSFLASVLRWKQGSPQISWCPLMADELPLLKMQRRQLLAPRLSKAQLLSGQVQEIRLNCRWSSLTFSIPSIWLLSSSIGRSKHNSQQTFLCPVTVRGWWLLKICRLARMQLIVLGIGSSSLVLGTEGDHLSESRMLIWASMNALNTSFLIEGITDVIAQTARGRASSKSATSKGCSKVTTIAPSKPNTAASEILWPCFRHSLCKPNRPTEVWETCRLK